MQGKGDYIMNIPLIIVILYVAFLLGLGIFMSKKEKKDGENFLLYKGKNGTWIWCYNSKFLSC